MLRRPLALEAGTWKSYAFIPVKPLNSGLAMEWNASP